MTKSRNIKLLFPLALFLGYVGFLIFRSTEPFLVKWLNGSFAFFVCLVLANIIRSAHKGDPDPPAE